MASSRTTMARWRVSYYSGSLSKNQISRIHQGAEALSTSVMVSPVHIPAELALEFLSFPTATTRDGYTLTLCASVQAQQAATCCQSWPSIHLSHSPQGFICFLRVFGVCNALWPSLVRFMCWILNTRAPISSMGGISIR